MKCITLNKNVKKDNFIHNSNYEYNYVMNFVYMRILEDNEKNKYAIWKELFDIGYDYTKHFSYNFQCIAYNDKLDICKIYIKELDKSYVFLQ
jgi:hypothetical protein